MASTDKISQHPTDILVRDLILTGRDATKEETSSVRHRISSAPFPAAAEHLARRLLEHQWHSVTTEPEYIGDVRRAALDDWSRVAVYARRGGHLAAIVGQSERILPISRHGDQSLPFFFVVYSADRGIILSGYQASSLTRIALPKDVRWLE